MGILTLVLFSIIGDLRAQHVDVRNGNVYYRSESGRTRELTSTGMDAFPSLSPDGKYVVFVRKTDISAHRPEGPSPFDNVVPKQSQLWITNVEGSVRPELVFAGPVKIENSSEYVSFASPKLSPDNRYVYFWIYEFVTELGLVRLDRKTMETTVISAGLKFDIVGSGRYAGDLVVQMRKAVPLPESEPFPGPVNYFWLITPEGREVGFVGESDKEVEAFLKNPDRKLSKDPTANRN